MNDTGRPVNLMFIVRETLARYGFLIESPPAAQAEAARVSEPILVAKASATCPICCGPPSTMMTRAISTKLKF